MKGKTDNKDISQIIELVVKELEEKKTKMII